MDFKHGPPPRIDRPDGMPLTDEDEHGLEAIRRQLDKEFAHSTEPVAVTAPAAPTRRVRVATVLGVLLVCASTGAAAVLVTPLYRAYIAQPSVETASRTATPAPGPVPVPSVVVAARPSSAARPAPRAEAVTTRPAAPVVPDVIRHREMTPVSPAPAAAAAPAVLAAPPSPQVAVAAPVPPRVDVPPPLEHGARGATGPSTWPLPLESAVAARAPLPLVEFASEHVRAAWETVKERVVRPSGELPHGARPGPEAP